MATPEEGRATWLADGVAGLSMAGLLLPEAVAYSGIANLPPQAGLMGLFAGLLVYGLVGRSRFAIVSATSSSAAVLGVATLSIAGPDSSLRLMLGAGLVLATGIAFLLAGMARLGAATNFIAKPVLRGFAFGLAMAIVVKQLPLWTGIHPGADALPLYSWQMLLAWPHWNLQGVGLGLVSLVALTLLSRFKRFPGALLVIAVGIALAHAVDLPARGIGLVGRIDLSLTPPSLPVLDREQWLRLSELSLAVLLLLYAESYGAIRTMALRHGDAISPNRDLLALGAANLLSGLFHGTPVGAGYSATSANEAAGASSRRSGQIAAAVVLLLVLSLLPLIELTPEPVLAAVVIHAVSHTLTLGAFRPYFQWRRDRVVVVAAALAVLLLGVLDGLLAGIAVSLAMTLRDLSEPRLSELGRLGDGHDFLSCAAHPDAQRVPGVLILRPEAPLFFANVERMLIEVRRRLAQPSSNGLVLSLEESPDLDGTALEALLEFVDELRRNGTALVLTRLKDPVQMVLQRTLGDQAAALLEPGSVDRAVARIATGHAAAA